MANSELRVKGYMQGLEYNAVVTTREGLVYVEQFELTRLTHVARLSMLPIAVELIVKEIFEELSEIAERFSDKED